MFFFLIIACFSSVYSALNLWTILENFHLAFKIQLKCDFFLKSSLITNPILTPGKVDHVINLVSVPCIFFICPTNQNYYNYLLSCPGYKLDCEVYC